MKNCFNYFSIRGHFPSNRKCKTKKSMFNKIFKKFPLTNRSSPPRNEQRLPLSNTGNISIRRSVK